MAHMYFTENPSCPVCRPAADSLLPEAGDASVDDSMHTPLLPAGDMQ
jgi:hypothetical protein